MGGEEIPRGRQDRVRHAGVRLVGGIDGEGARKPGKAPAAGRAGRAGSRGDRRCAAAAGGGCATRGRRAPPRAPSATPRRRAFATKRGSPRGGRCRRRWRRSIRSGRPATRAPPFPVPGSGLHPERQRPPRPKRRPGDNELIRVFPAPSGFAGEFPRHGAFARTHRPISTRLATPMDPGVAGAAGSLTRPSRHGCTRTTLRAFAPLSSV